MRTTRRYRSALLVATLTGIFSGEFAVADDTDTFFGALQSGKTTEYLTKKVQDYVADNMPDFLKQTPPQFEGSFSTSAGNVGKTGYHVYDFFSGQAELIQQGASDLSNPGTTDPTPYVENKPATKWMEDTVNSYLPDPVAKAIDTIQESGGLDNYLQSKVNAADSWIQDKYQTL